MKELDMLAAGLVVVGGDKEPFAQGPGPSPVRPLGFPLSS